MQELAKLGARNFDSRMLDSWPLMTISNERCSGSNRPQKHIRIIRMMISGILLLSGPWARTQDPHVYVVFWPLDCVGTRAAVAKSAAICRKALSGRSRKSWSSKVPNIAFYLSQNNGSNTERNRAIPLTCGQSAELRW